LALGGDLRALALTDLGIAEAWTARFDEANRHLDDGIALARQIGDETALRSRHARNSSAAAMTPR